MNPNLVITIIEALEAEKVPYMLAGSFASMVYGIPRSTKDVDFVIELGQESFAQLIQRLSSEFDLDPQQHLETLTWTRRYILAARKTSFKVELFLKSDDAHHLEQWARKKHLFNPIIQRDVWMPTAEDVVIQKIRWGRPQDKIDAENVIGVQENTLDWAYIEHWCQAHGTREMLAEIRSGLPPIQR